MGECAGEIVSHAEFGLAHAERQVFEAQVFLDENQYQQAGETAYESMLQAAKTLVRSSSTMFRRITIVLRRNSAHASTTPNFFGINMRAASLVVTSCVRMKKRNEPYTPDEAHRRVEEAQLVIEAAHSCYGKLLGSRSLPRTDSLGSKGSSRMKLQHINLKFYIENPETVNLEDFTAVFNTLDPEAKATEELLIDVAEYLHVHNGPGIMLIGHNANYSLDNRAGRLGLLYNRKEPLEGTNRRKACPSRTRRIERGSDSRKRKSLEVQRVRSASDHQ